MSQEFQGVYDPSQVDIIVGGVTLQGVDEGTFVETERMKPEEFTAKAGARGDFTFIKNLDRTGKIKITLKQNAARGNEYLSSLNESDAVFDAQIVRKGNYKELASATTCVIGLRPRLNHGDTESPRQWEILCGVLKETAKAG